MRNALSSPLASALIVPGLGQILNGQLKKGIALLSAVFLLFLGLILRVYLAVRAAVKELGTQANDPGLLLEGVAAQKLPLLWSLIILLGILWIYAILDAFLSGRKVDRRNEPEEQLR